MLSSESRSRGIAELVSLGHFRLMRALILTAVLSLIVARTSLAQSTEPPRPLTVDGIRAWQRTGALRGWRPWPARIARNVCGDNQDELFLAIGGFSRGMTYALFTRQGHSWRLLSDRVDCTAGMLDVLSTEHGGYHDFAAFQRSGRGGFFVRVYSWSGARYLEKVNWEMTHDQLYERE